MKAEFQASKMRLQAEIRDVAREEEIIRSRRGIIDNKISACTRQIDNVNSLLAELEKGE